MGWLYDTLAQCLCRWQGHAPADTLYHYQDPTGRRLVSNIDPVWSPKDFELLGEETKCPRCFQTITLKLQKDQHLL